MDLKQIPKIIFIVPYRNRLSHKIFFSKYMLSNLSDQNDFEIYFSHQSDERPFNRGGIKNIGFLALKNKYPNNYKDITFVFNDIDTIPYENLFDYKTKRGIIKHFYGFHYALGGILSITGYDFEKINGFPNFWGWGMEDALLQKRCERYKLKIDRSNFYPVGSQEILHLFDGVSRIINKNDTKESKKDVGKNGLKSLCKVTFFIDTKSNIDSDNLNNIESKYIYFINILDFYCNESIGRDNDVFYNYDLREPLHKILNTDRIINKNDIKNEIKSNNWANIPFYPTSEVKQKMIQNIGENKTNEIINQHLNTNYSSYSYSY
jgi:hypothetical protein